MVRPFVQGASDLAAEKKYTDYLKDVVNRPIRPSDIDSSRHFWDAFGHQETEISAKWIVRYQQHNNPEKWEPFSNDDIERFYCISGYQCFRFNNLIHDSYIIRYDGLNYVTPGFIVRCFGSTKSVHIVSDTNSA